MARVPSDPAQVIVNHASFRVQLGAASARALSLGDTARITVGPRGATAGRRRLAPVVWSGQAAPGDPLAGELMQAVRQAGTSGGTQVLPRIDGTTVRPTVVGQRSPHSPTGLLDGVRPARGAYDPDEPAVGYVGDGDGDGYGDGDGRGYGEEPAAGRRPRDRQGRRVRHAWYPGRRMNLGIVLLPLRVFLGFISIYAGMGKLCDRVYFDGGERGSMVKWLSSLHPWAAAEPLRDAALNHPVGAGLSIAFLQVVVGVLTVFGLWQRVAAAFGAALSIALLVTVSWRTVPVYDAPDFIYLAAWSPLVIAGAPVYSIDGHLAGDAWRRLGPRVTLWDLRRRVLRRGTVLATVVIGLTLLIGSVLGAAVRASSTRQDGPSPMVTPTNNLPGAPLPEVTGGAGTAGASPEPTGSASAARATPETTATQAPTTAPGRTQSAGGTATTGTTGTGTGGGTGTAPGAAEPGSGSGSGSGGGAGGGAAEPPPAPAAPPAPQAPEPPQPEPKPSQGAIGGLLGSHSPTGLLLGMHQGGRPGAPRGMA